MPPLLQSEPQDPSEVDPIFIEEKLRDGSIRFHMNEKLRRRAEAAVAKLSSQKIADFERRVIQAVQSGKR